MAKKTKNPVVFSDVDGTIYARDGYVSNFNLEAVKNNGISFNIATGNPFCPKMKKLAKLLDADYIIGSSGSQIYDYKKRKFAHEKYIKPETAQKIFDILKKYDASCAAWSSEAFYVFKKSDFEFINKIYFKYETFDQFEIYEPGKTKLKKIAKIEVYFEDTKHLDKIQKELEEVDIYVIKTHMNFEILPHGASKGTSILWMLENIYKEYDKDEIMVIGDSENDYSMFKRFKFSYAMDNAKNELKNKAAFVTKDVKESGLGHAVLDYIEKFKKIQQKK